MGLTNSQYDEIMRHYSDQQSENRRMQTMRQNEVSAKIPGFDRISEDIAALSMNYAIAALDGSGSDRLTFEELQNNIKVLSAKKAELLISYGFPADYLAPVFKCDKCQDTGYIDNVKCQCFKKAVTEIFYSRTNSKNIRKNETFDTFSLEWYSKEYIDPISKKSSYDNMKKVYQVAYDFAMNFGKEGSIKNLLFCGESGLGKTFLSNCIANHLINGCYSVIYLTAIEFFETYSKSTFNKDVDNSEEIQEITDCDLLIIDDLGTELVNSFTNSRLFYCINDRLLKDKSTIISTNLSLEKIFEFYSERIFSRITSSYKYLKFYGDNIRLKKPFRTN